LRYVPAYAFPGPQYHIAFERNKKVSQRGISHVCVCVQYMYVLNMEREREREARNTSRTRRRDTRKIALQRVCHLPAGLTIHKSKKGNPSTVSNVTNAFIFSTYLPRKWSGSPRQPQS
jgi:hypothetical protein